MIPREKRTSFLDAIPLLDSIGDRYPLWEEDQIKLHQILDDLVTAINAIPKGVERIEGNVQDTSDSRISMGNKVFVVHGHDGHVKEAVARFIERLGLEAVVLHEHANAGATIIEKIEKHSDVSFAVVLLTPDDIGASKSELQKIKSGDTTGLQSRARQNVVLELGYFVAKLTRGRVCALLDVGVEIPSDIQGMLYIERDMKDAWRWKLAKEMKEAGLKVDVNNAL